MPRMYPCPPCVVPKPSPPCLNKGNSIKIECLAFSSDAVPGRPCGIPCLLPTLSCKMTALTFPVLLGNGFSAPQFIVMSRISFLWKIAPVFYPLQCPEDRRKDYKVCKWYSLPAPPLWSDSLLKRMWLEMTDLLGSVWWWRKGGETGVCFLVRIVQRSKLNLLLQSGCEMTR